MRVLTPPYNIRKEDLSESIFLAGTIEMGKSIDWQKDLIESFKDNEGIILNPRRPDWDSSWEQDINNHYFRQQVEWELYGLEKCGFIAMYLVPGTMSRISLLELGLYAQSKKILVCCPEGYDRKGNVDIVCKKYKVPVVESYDEFKTALSEQFNN